jgi:hypothetical protein
MAVLARELADQPTLAETLEKIVVHAAASIRGAEYAAITSKRRNGEFATIAASGDLPIQVDDIEYELREGPCLTSLNDSTPCHSGQVGADPRWPRFGPVAQARTGVLSMLSNPLALDEDESLGSLNLYSTKADAFSADSVRETLIFATHSAVAMSRAAVEEENAHLQRALSSNRSIGMAIGILMARHLLTSEQAFNALRVVSQHTHRKLADIALDVIEVGDLDLPARPGAPDKR